MTPGLMIAAPASGTGKTTVMLGLLRAFRDAGLAVQPFKSGPDYIDPAFHRAACGRASFNLDGWAMSAALLDTLGQRGADAELVLAEGSMGLFDGVARPGATGMGSSAETARRMGWPVILVIDVSGQAQSAAATALAVGLWLSALNVQYRDVRYTIPFLTQFWLFATPVAYPASLVPEAYRPLYGLNPMVGVVEGFRWALLGTDAPDWGMVAVMTPTPSSTRATSGPAARCSA